MVLRTASADVPPVSSNGFIQMDPEHRSSRNKTSVKNDTDIKKSVLFFIISMQNYCFFWKYAKKVVLLYAFFKKNHKKKNVGTRTEYENDHCTVARDEAERREDSHAHFV